MSSVTADIWRIRSALNVLARVDTAIEFIRRTDETYMHNFQARPPVVSPPMADRDRAAWHYNIYQMDSIVKHIQQAQQVLQNKITVLDQKHTEAIADTELAIIISNNSSIQKRKAEISVLQKKGHELEARLATLDHTAQTIERIRTQNAFQDNIRQQTNDKRWRYIVAHQGSLSADDQYQYGRILAPFTSTLPGIPIADIWTIWSITRDNPVYLVFRACTVRKLYYRTQELALHLIRTYTRVPETIIHMLYFSHSQKAWDLPTLLRALVITCMYQKPILSEYDWQPVTEALYRISTGATQDSGVTHRADASGDILYALVLNIIWSAGYELDIVESSPKIRTVYEKAIAFTNQRWVVGSASIDISNPNPCYPVSLLQ